MIQEQRLIEEFKKLCLINAPALAERECVEVVRQELERMGLKVWEDNAAAELGGNANNLIAELKGTVSGAPRIFLSAHFDTVEPTEGLVILEEDGILKTSGNTILGADDKGGMVPIMEAVRCIQESGEPHGDIVLLFSVAEEIGLKGAAVLPIQDLNLDFGFVFDTGPPVGSFVTRTATHDKIEVIIHGKPAHSGKDPEKGINAIQVAARAIDGMKLGRIGPEMTANLGRIEGGTADNVVCPFVRIRGEARSTNVPELDVQIDHMVKRFEEAAQEFGAKVEIKLNRHYGAYELDPSSSVVQVATKAASNLGLSGELRTTLGGSDANIYNTKGVPTIVVATGMEKIHTHEEQISISSLIQTAELAVELIREAARAN